MKKLILLFIATTVFAQNSTQKVNFVLDNWHKAAAEVHFEDYMNAMTNDAVYIGTDANENWTKTQFMAFAKPYFDKGKAWNFSVIERHVYLSKDKKMAWFDELLNTQMKICRGSGVLVKRDKDWKIQHYVLSMTVPNEKTLEVIKIKSIIEDKIIDNKSTNK